VVSRAFTISTLREWKKSETAISEAVAEAIKAAGAGPMKITLKNA
jgi:anti-sigma regulatory factor (Ser/Thr protein kinase)